MQARAVIEALVDRRPDLQIVFTFFSQSAEAYAREVGADVATYLPWDLPGTSGRVLDALRPDVVVFTKTEVWPVLTEEAERRDIPTAIIGATVREGAGRLRPLARWAMRSTWVRLSVACAAAEADGLRLLAMGVRPAALHTPGDPSVDAAAERAALADSGATWLAPFRGHGRRNVVAGSTWLEDESRLLPALKSARALEPGLFAIVAPHEPHPLRVTSLVSRLNRDGWRVDTLSNVESSGSAVALDAVVVDRVGVLADLYSVAEVAFVGGGFGARGLHSVLEPAAAGKPVVFGPRHHGSAAAGALIESGGAKIAPDAGVLAEVLGAWLQDDAVRNRAGRCAFGYIENHRGAAGRTAELLDQLMRSELA